MLNYYLPAVYSMLTLFLIAALGFLLVRLRKIGDDFIRSLSLFLIDIALPCWLFTKLLRTGRENLFSSLLFPAAAVLILGSGFLLGMAVLALWRVKGEKKRSALAMVSLGNSGYLPLAVSQALPVALPAISGILPESTAALYIGMYLVMMNPILWTVGNYLVAGGVRKPRFGELFTPPAFSVVAGVLVVLLGGDRLYTDNGNILFYFFNTLETIGAMALPIVLICLGGTIGRASMIGFSRGGESFRFTASVISIRLFLMQLLFFLFYFATRRLINLEPVQYWVLFLEMVTPPATNLSVMTIRAGKNEALVAETLFFSYLGFFVVFPVYLALFLSLPIFH